MKKANLKIWTGSCWQSIFPVTTTDQVKHAITGESLTSVLQDASLAPDVLQEAEKYTDKAIKETTETFAEELSKTEQQLKDYTDEQIASFSLYNIVTELPSVGYPNKIYLVPRSETEDDNRYDEYLWVNDSWEYQGTKTVKIDLTNYQTKEDAALQHTQLNDKKLDKVATEGPLRAYGISKDGTQCTLIVAENPSEAMHGRLVSYASEPDGAPGAIVGAGRLIQRDPWLPFHVANMQYVDRTVKAVGDRVSLLEQKDKLLSQFIQETSSTGSTVLTAGGKMIFDIGNGGKSRLLSIEGDTYVDKNLLTLDTLRPRLGTLSYSFNTRHTELTVSVTDVSANGSLQPTFFGFDIPVLPAGDYTFSCASTIGINGRVVPIVLIMGDEAVTLGSEGMSNFPVVHRFKLDTPKRVQVNLAQTVANESIVLNKMQLEFGANKTEFVPQGDGRILHSPWILGIKEKSIFKDESHETLISFKRSYSCKFGKTLDFVNKKIIDQSVELTFDGSDDENWSVHTVGPNNDIKVATIMLPIDCAAGIGSAIARISWPHLRSGSGLTAYEYTFYSIANQAYLEICLPDLIDINDWKNRLKNKNLQLIYLAKDIQNESELLEDDIILTVFNQGTQSIYEAYEFGESLYPYNITVRQEYVFTSQSKNTTLLKPIAPAHGDKLVPESVGDLGTHTYIFTGDGDFVYGEPILLDYGEKLVTEFAINPDKLAKANNCWFGICLGNIPKDINGNAITTYPYMFNTFVYAQSRVHYWGQYMQPASKLAISNDSSYSEFFLNEYEDTALESYYYRIEVIRTGVYKYNYRVLRLKKGVDTTYRVVDEVKDINTFSDNPDLKSYYVQSIMLVSSQQQLPLRGLRFYKTQIL